MFQHLLGEINTDETLNLPIDQRVEGSVSAPQIQNTLRFIVGGGDQFIRNEALNDIATAVLCRVAGKLMACIAHRRLMTKAMIKMTSRHKTIAAPLGSEKIYEALNPITTEVR